MMSSDESSDGFVTFGTALEPLDEAAMPRKKAFTLEDQVARDSKGRRRFHGAFTGGFSAGFMNSVGSLEGWKPSEFKSSRAERSSAVEQKPQDYMDDEDMGEFGIAPSRLAARADYDSASSTRKRALPSFHDGPIPGVPVLQQLLQKVRETVGIRLLKSMGWKPGQGVGPRVDALSRRLDIAKTYGCEPAPGPSDDSDDYMDMDGLTFAPKDIKPYIVQPKKDSFGLGYSGLDRHSVLGSLNVPSDLKYSDKSRKVRIRGQAFGVGAFEEEDEDIYSREDMSQYDFSMGDETSKVSPAQRTAPGVLAGFVQAKIKVVKKSFPPPLIPPQFKGRHEIRKSRFEPSVLTTSSKPTGLGRHDISAQTRAVMINDENELPPPKAQVSQTIEMPSGVEIGSPSTPSQPQRALTGATFKPFIHTPDKQRRYEQYLALPDKAMLYSLQPVSLSPWEREREHREFEQAALIYKPLAGVMEDRFTPAQLSDDINNPLAKVEKIQHGDETKRNAAKMKLYGTLTREESDWGPCSLLCKRFNVPEPGTSHKTIEPRKKTKYSIFDSLDSLVKKEPQDVPASCRTPLQRDVEDPPTIQDVEPNLLQSLPPSTELPTKSNELFIDPITKVDLFKAIFLDSSDEDEQSNTNHPVFEEPVKNSARNLSPPRGIFANIDLEALSTRKPTDSIAAPEVVPLPTLPTPITPAPLIQPIDDGTYGPKLPDRLVASTAVEDTSSSSEENEWEEKVKIKSHKHKKSKKHKKHKVKKHKKKHKK